MSVHTHCWSNAHIMIQILYFYQELFGSICFIIVLGEIMKAAVFEFEPWNYGYAKSIYLLKFQYSSPTIKFKRKQ